MPRATLAVVAIPQHLFPLLPLPPPLCCWQCLHPDAARGCHPCLRIVGDKTKAADSSGISPPVQSLGLSMANVVQNQAHPCKGVQYKEWACAGLTPKQLGTPQLHPKRAGEPGMQDGVQAEASNPPAAPQGTALVAPPRPAPMAHGLLSAVGPRRIARLQSLYEVGCIIT